MPKHVREVLVASVIMLASAIVLLAIAGLLHRPDDAGAAEPYQVLGYQLKSIFGGTVSADEFLKLEKLQTERQ